MSPRSAMGWPEWEEKNLLPWLDAHRALSWKARSHAYYEQYRVVRTVESLRGKKYHILRKRRRTSAGSPEHRGNRKRSGAIHRSVGDMASLESLPDTNTAQGSVDKWLQTVPTVEPSHTRGSESTQTKSSRPGRMTLVPVYYRPPGTRSSSCNWDYVHRVCAARKLRYQWTKCEQHSSGIQVTVI